MKNQSNKTKSIYLEFAGYHRAKTSDGKMVPKRQGVGNEYISNLGPGMEVDFYIDTDRGTMRTDIWGIEFVKLVEVRTK